MELEYSAWQSLMRAPWGSFTPQAIEDKKYAHIEYNRSVYIFWSKRKMDIPVVLRDDEKSAAKERTLGNKTSEDIRGRNAPLFERYSHDVSYKDFIETYTIGNKVSIDTETNNT